MGRRFGVETLEEVMCKMWRHSGDKPGVIPQVKTEIVLNAFTGYCYMCKEKGHRATQCPSKEEKKSEAVVLEAALTETVCIVCARREQFGGK